MRKRHKAVLSCDGHHAEASCRLYRPANRRAGHTDPRAGSANRSQAGGLPANTTAKTKTRHRRRVYDQ